MNTQQMLKVIEGEIAKLQSAADAGTFRQAPEKGSQKHEGVPVVAESPDSH